MDEQRVSFGIIGVGVVGRATYSGLRSAARRCSLWDKFVPTGNELSAVVDEDVVFICVPTLWPPGGAAQDTSAVAEAVNAAMRGKCSAVVVRSTTQVGVLEHLHTQYRTFQDKVLCHWPEFLTERYALNDFITTNWALIGTGTPVDHYLPPTALIRLLQARFPHIHIVSVTLTESQLFKLALNGFFATKVAYANFVADLCERLNLDYRVIRSLMEMDGRVTREHLAVPGPDGERGFGGRCLPKDTRALVALAAEHGLSADLLNAVLDYNAAVRRTPV